MSSFGGVILVAAGIKKPLDDLETRLQELDLQEERKKGREFIISH